MAIFDDPKKELQRLQQQLLDEEEEELVEEYEEDYEDFFGEEYEDEYDQEDYLRNFTSGSGQSRDKRERSIFDEIEDAFDEVEEDDEEPYAVYVEEKRNIFGKRKVITEKKDDNRKLKIMILLEIIALLCVAIWWVVMQL